MIFSSWAAWTSRVVSVQTTKSDTGDFLFHRPLGFQALPALDGIPAALAQTPGLRGGGTGHADGRIEKRLPPGFQRARG